METFNLYCKRCGIELFMGNAQEEFGELIIICSMCRAKNIIAPYVLNKIPIPKLWQVIGWRD
jgi:hypothetical protein